MMRDILAIGTTMKRVTFSYCNEFATVHVFLLKIIICLFFELLQWLNPKISNIGSTNFEFQQLHRLSTYQTIASTFHRHYYYWVRPNNTLCYIQYYTVQQVEKCVLFSKKATPLEKLVTRWRTAMNRSLIIKN